MICISDKIIDIARDLGFVVSDNSLSGALKFIVRKNVVSILGVDDFSDDDINLEPMNNGFKVNIIDGKSILVTNENYHLFMKTDDANVEIIRTVNDDFVSSINKYDVNGVIVSDIFNIFNNSFSYSKSINGCLDLRVSANSIGVIKSGKAMYELTKLFPIEDESLLKKIASAVNGDNIVYIDEDLNGLTANNYSDLYAALNKKFEFEKNDEKTRVLSK